MNNTANFKTKSLITERKMPKILGNNQYRGKTIVALDGGYSAVKGVSGNKTFIYPSYAKKVSNLQFVGELKDNDILLRDNLTGTEWAIGSLAERLMDRKDLEQTTDASLFTRYRYRSEIYKAIMSAGLAIGLLETVGGNDIYLATGLPSTYKDADGEELKDALSGEYNLSIKIGNEPYRTFRFNLDKEHISVMEQPQGTLLASAYDKNGEMLPNGRQIISSNSLIYDIGFGTEDIFAIRGGINNGHQTYSDTGMKSVFEATIKEIMENHTQANYKIFEFQKFLEKGIATYFDRATTSSKEVPFEEILLRKNSDLCKKSISRLLEEYDNLMDYEYLIVTGGTGESRFEQIKSMLSGLSHLTVLKGNQNDETLPFVFSNVRGYYMFQYLQLKREMMGK